MQRAMKKCIFCQSKGKKEDIRVHFVAQHDLVQLELIINHHASNNQSRRRVSWIQNDDENEVHLIIECEMYLTRDTVALTR